MQIVSVLSTDGKAKVLTFALRLRQEEEAQKGDEKTEGTKWPQPRSVQKGLGFFPTSGEMAVIGHSRIACQFAKWARNALLALFIDAYITTLKAVRGLGHLHQQAQS